MHLDLKTRVIQSPQVAFRKISGKTVLIKAPLSTLHTLNRVGEFIWHELEHQQEVSELIKKICEKFEIDQDHAEKDALEFLNEMLAKDLIKENSE